ncbi:MAG TPA: hypothetical protein VNC78_05015 [Actinomycetota bacterium]|nr:hypothetical protein [Actinomycetota bacterium]
MATSVDTVDGKGSVALDITLIPDEVKTLITVLKSQVFLLGKDWDSLLDPEKKELALSAVETVTELNNLVRGEPEATTDLRIIV